VGEQIRAGQILPGHIIIDKDTGDRRRIEEHPLFTEMIETARLRRDEERRANAEDVHVQQEKRRGVTRYAHIAVAVAGVGFGAYAIHGKLTSGSDDDGPVVVSGLSAGKVEATMSFPSRAEQNARRSSRKKAGRRSGAAGKAGGWDDSVELDMDSEGGDDRLDDSQVNPVLQASGDQLGDRKST